MSIDSISDLTREEEVKIDLSCKFWVLSFAMVKLFSEMLGSGYHSFCREILTLLAI